MYPIRMRVGYGVSAYRVRHMAYPITLINLTVGFGQDMSRYTSGAFLIRSDTPT
jgi:hypothetical protein